MGRHVAPEGKGASLVDSPPNTMMRSTYNIFRGVCFITGFMLAEEGWEGEYRNG